MATRRGFLAGMLATGLIPKPGWADAGDPAYLAAARLPGGTYHLFGLTDAGAEVFRLPLPGRGHAAAAHPERPEAVAFARRPGTFAIVIDCARGGIAATLEAPEGRHFYGHGAFSADGSLLFTTENDYDAARGVIGIWNAAHGYARIGEFASNGVGPHEICLLPGTERLVIANGGIETHPASGRAKLNIPFMRPNLCHVDLTGGVLDLLEPEPAQRRNSIRHLAVRGDGLVAFAMQWQGEGADSPALLGLYRAGGAPVLARAPGPDHRRMQGYAGSVAFSGDGARAAITSPRGGLIQIFETPDGGFHAGIDRTDVCGISAARVGFIHTAGTGAIGLTNTGAARGTDAGAGADPEVIHNVAWDNHLVRISALS